MEFDKTKWSCPWNSDQNCTQNSARGCWSQGQGGVVGVKEGRGWWGQGGKGSGGGVGVVGVQWGRGWWRSVG